MGYSFPWECLFHYIYEDIEYKEEDFRAALKTYNKLLACYEAEENKNYSNIAQCNLIIGKCHLALNEKDEAREALKDVVRLKPHDDKFPLIKEYCREAYGLLSRIF